LRERPRTETAGEPFEETSVDETGVPERVDEAVLVLNAEGPVELEMLSLFLAPPTDEGTGEALPLVFVLAVNELCLETGGGSPERERLPIPMEDEELILLRFLSTDDGTPLPLNERFVGELTKGETGGSRRVEERREDMLGLALVLVLTPASVVAEAAGSGSLDSGHWRCMMTDLVAHYV
jgi:hypothetical protein